MKVREVIELIKNTSSSNTKKEILEANKSELLDVIFADTYDKSRNYYVKKYNKNITPIGFNQWTIEDNYDIFHEMLNMLHERYWTGDAAVSQVEDTISQFILEDQPILHAIMERNLKIGIALDSFNKASDNTIEKFQVALAKKLQDTPNIDPVDGDWFVSRKLDGARCIAICENIGANQKVIFMSRQGKEFKTLGNLVMGIKQMFSQMPDGKYVLDGEICIVDENGDEHFDWIMKEISRKNHTIENPCYQIFDMLRWDEFVGEIKSAPFSCRLSSMVSTYYDTRPNNIRLVEQERLDSQETLDKWMSRVKDGNWEGLMIRKDVPYEGKRTKNLLKIKAMQDAEYVVEDVVNGKAVYNEGGVKEYDIISALLIRHKGNIVKVGSGLSKEQRISWFSHPDEIIGKTITVQYFEETKDSKTGEYSLRFPVLKYVYDNGRLV